jgi:hypothetical protein
MPTPSDATVLQATMQLSVNEPDPDYTVSILGPIEDAFVWLHLLIGEGRNRWIQ